jgi:hypothetical protein
MISIGLRVFLFLLFLSGMMSAAVSFCGHVRFGGNSPSKRMKETTPRKCFMHGVQHSTCGTQHHHWLRRRHGLRLFKKVSYQLLNIEQILL